jgi:hypothetical protein
MRGWRSFWAIGWTASVVALASAQYQFVHLRSYTLADLFDGTANGIGSNIGDVAFDGTNLYVAGYHTSSGANRWDGANQQLFRRHKLCRQ